MRILYSNQIPNATITCSAENPTYTFTTAFNDSRLSRVGKTITCASEWIKFAFSSAVSADYFIIKAHNFTDNAVVTLEGNNSDSWASPAFSQVLTVDTTITGELPVTETYLYWRLTITDAANPDGVLSIGYCFLGMSMTMPGMELGPIIKRLTTSSVSKSASGQSYVNKGYKYWHCEFAFTGVSQADITLINNFFETMDIGVPFILIPWENDLDIQEPIYCILTDAPDNARAVNYGILWITKIVIDETF